MVSSLAGSPLACGGPVDGTGSSASFNNPVALTMAPDGRVVVGDTYNHLVRIVTTTGLVSSLPATATAFPDIRGIATDAAGNIYYPDNNSARIFKAAPGGAVTVFSGSGAIGMTDGPASTATFTSPYGVVADARHCPVRC